MRGAGGNAGPYRERLGLRGAVAPRIGPGIAEAMSGTLLTSGLMPGVAPAGASLSHMALHGPLGAEKVIEG